MTSDLGPGALDDLRVLDLADAKGIYCGKLLAGMGADVIRIEPPGGGPDRRRPPFVDDLPGPERSLFHLAMNAGKRSITLNIECEDGVSLFRRLARTADIVVESFAPGYLDELDLGEAMLRRENPAVIVTSITPFGQDGPYRDFEGPDLVNLALGGQLWLSGFPGEPPQAPYGEQSYFQGALHAAYATLIALRHRDVTGEGQHVDVAIQSCVATAQETAMPTYDLTGHVRSRVGSQRRSSAWGLYPCADGYVQWMAGLRNFRNLVAWMRDEGVDVTAYGGSEWDDPHYRRTHADEFDATFLPWALTRTKADLAAEGQRRKVPLAPVQDVRDIVDDPHLRERGFWREIDHPQVGRAIASPGVPYRLGATLARLDRAPMLGEHNTAIYIDEMGLSRGELATLAAVGAF